MSKFLKTYGKYGELHLWSQLNRPDVSSDFIDKALKHGSVDVREAAASNINATKEQLDIASNDDHFYVREAAAKHPNATKEQLDIASNDNEYYTVRIAAASNINATKEQLDIASNDDNDFVRAAAKKNLESRK
jgi:hypothetical protein